MVALDEKYCVGLEAAAIEVIETMVGMSPTAVERGADTIPAAHDEILGTLGFTGTTSGVLTLHASADLARKLYAETLDLDPVEIESKDEIADCFGEIANLICGGFKNLWVEGGNAMDLAIPSVQCGESVSQGFHSSGQAAVSIRVLLEAGELVARLWFKE